MVVSDDNAMKNNIAVSVVVILLVLACDPLHATITNINELFDSSPKSDPAFAVITQDFKIRRNGVLVDLDATISLLPTSQIPLAEYSDELIVVQGLRAIYHMDRGRSNHLPWTAGTLYEWMRTKIKGINISDTTGASYCCATFDEGLYIVVKAQDDFNRDFDRTWKGISGNINLYCHEVRHVDGYGHVSCCGIAGGCDQRYDANDLSPYGMGWWLNKAWLFGEINVGFGCLSANDVLDIANWHLSACNSSFRNRFCEDLPVLLSMPDYPGGVCELTLHDWNNDGIVSIVGDVPPFVNCVYFQDCPSGIDRIAAGDCNDDGILSIVGDVPCFVQCVYFGSCQD